MSTDFGQWDRVASELRACREAQQQAWGDVDNATLGRYLAGDVTPAERLRIETELQHRPELRKLTDLVSDVLRDCEPVAAPEKARPAFLPFPAAKSAPNPTARRWRQWVAVAAAACVLLVLGYTVLPRGAVPSSSFPHGPLATVAAPGSPVRNTVVAFHQPLAAGTSEMGDRRDFFAGNDDGRAAAKWTPPIDHVAVVLADGCAKAAETYQRHGDLDLAEFSYQLAYNIREWNLGPKAEPTLETRRNLGAVYQTAFNLNEAVAATQVVSPPAATAGLADKKAEREIQSSAALLRDRLKNQPAAVRNSVVPVLVANLNEAKTPQEREQLGRALAELGPAAKDAVPALDACLRDQDLTPQAREAVLEAKLRLENAAADAPAALPAPPP